MATINFTGQSDVLDGFPRDLLSSGERGSIDNGQMAVARPVRSMERALQILGARRRCTFPALRHVVTFDTTGSPDLEVPLCKIPREPYSKHVLVFGLYSTNPFNGDPSEIVLEFGVSGSTTATYTTAEFPGTVGTSIDEAEKFEVGYHVIGDGDNGDLGYEELTLRVNFSAFENSADACTIYSVTVLVIPENSVDSG